MKTVDEHFRDWFNEPFGFSYGTGERPILAVLKKLASLTHLNESGNNYTYDHTELENGLGKPIEWLLINALARNNDIGYCTSPRFGWFYGNPGGKKLIEYINSHSVDDMYETVANYDSDYNFCFNNYCSCTENQENHRCKNNPFWEQK